ncbi:MAG: hypothetical protein JJ992_29770, partial [Planctomycetes bacterium]|nr:hypothetical protein [Planctomycetota bacterium]
MDQENRPQLNLGEPPGRLKPPAAGGIRPWIAVVIALQLVILAALVFFLWRSKPDIAGGAPDSAHQDPGGWKSLAIELENRSLDEAAADAWEKYLNAAGDPEDRAEVLYRIGKLHLQAEQYQSAAAALIRCEQLADKDSGLDRKVGPLLITCLRRLGRYGEVGRELSRRVEAGAGQVGQGRVLATLGGEALTEADLDRMIERRVDEMLAVQGAAGDETLRKQILEQFSRPAMRQQLFQELLQRELFTRRARELHLDRDEEFQQARESLEAGLLANRFLAREMEKIQPTDVDIQAFYQLNQNAYRQPETAQVL